MSEVIANHHHVSEKLVPLNTAKPVQRLSLKFGLFFSDRIEEGDPYLENTWIPHYANLKLTVKQINYHHLQTEDYAKFHELYSTIGCALLNEGQRKEKEQKKNRGNNRSNIG